MADQGRTTPAAPTAAPAAAPAAAPVSAPAAEPAPAKDVLQEACRVGVRTPTFNAEDPMLWFTQLEGQFVLSNITADTTKFYYVLSQLDPQHTMAVRDLVVSPPASGKLKTELIKRLSASQERKLKQFVLHEELGDRKTSQFLRYLQQLAGPTVPEDLIRTIWSSRLPTNLQTVVASQVNMSLENVAELADRINDIVTVNGQVAGASAPPMPPMVDFSPASTSTQQLIEMLTRTVADLSRRLETMSMELIK